MTSGVFEAGVVGSLDDWFFNFEKIQLEGSYRYPTVDGQNPAPPRMMIIPLFIGF